LVGALAIGNDVSGVIVGGGGGENENQKLGGETRYQRMAVPSFAAHDLRNSRGAAEGIRRARLDLLEKHRDPAEGCDEEFRENG